MTPNSITVGTLALLVMGAQSALAQDLATSIVGTWQLTDLVRKELATGTTVKTLGEKPAGHIVYTKGNRAVWFFAANDRKGPAGASPTDAERSALFNTMAGCSEALRNASRSQLSAFGSDALKGRLAIPVSYPAPYRARRQPLTVRCAASRHAHAGPRGSIRVAKGPSYARANS